MAIKHPSDCIKTNFTSQRAYLGRNYLRVSNLIHFVLFTETYKMRSVYFENHNKEILYFISFGEIKSDEME